MKVHPTSTVLLTLEITSSRPTSSTTSFSSNLRLEHVYHIEGHHTQRFSTDITPPVSRQTPSTHPQRRRAAAAANRLPHEGIRIRKPPRGFPNVNHDATSFQRVAAARQRQLLPHQQRPEGGFAKNSSESFHDGYKSSSTIPKVKLNITTPLDTLHFRCRRRRSRRGVPNFNPQYLSIRWLKRFQIKNSASVHPPLPSGNIVKSSHHFLHSLMTCNNMQMRSKEKIFLCS